jgi:mannose-6-phosphate isomerase-like protein (cupin superfamily)
LRSEGGGDPRIAIAEVEKAISGVEVTVLDVERRERSVPVSMASFIVPVGQRTDVDVHDVDEIWVIARGSGKLRYGSDVFDAKVGDAYWFASRVEHQIENSGLEELSVVSIWWHA